MKRKLRTLAAVAVGTLILMTAAADAGATAVTPEEAQRLRNQAQQYQKMKRIAGADGVITRAEQARLNHQAQKLRRMIRKAKAR